MGNIARRDFLKTAPAAAGAVAYRAGANGGTVADADIQAKTAPADVRLSGIANIWIWRNITSISEGSRAR